MNEKSLIPADELIVIKQLPVIEEQLHGIKAVIEERVAKVMALECTEDTVSAIRTLRASLTQDFNELEERRKLVKERILAPYKAFDAIYKECVTDVYKPADAELKSRIDEVDERIKAQKRRRAEEYFDEYRAAKGVDFVTFQATGIKVNKSSSEKGINAQSKAFIDRICDDLNLIYIQEHSAEILVEYKKTFNVSASITAVCERHKAVEAEKERAEREETAKREREEAAAKVHSAAPAPLSAPKEETHKKTIEVPCPFTRWRGESVEELKELKSILLRESKRLHVELVR